MVGMNDRMNCNSGILYDDNQQYYSHDDPATSGKTVVILFVSIPAVVYLAPHYTALFLGASVCHCCIESRNRDSCTAIFFKFILVARAVILFAMISLFSFQGIFRNLRVEILCMEFIIRKLITNVFETLDLLRTVCWDASHILQQ